MVNAASGVAVDDEYKVKFMELKRKKEYRYIIFKMDQAAPKITVEKTGAPNESYDEFTNSLPEGDCRYAVYHFEFVTKDNCQKSKIFFISWSPDVSRVRSKMLYASSKDRLKRELDVHHEVQATDTTEVDVERLKERCH
ncbi:hypothetical protein GOP47_0023485 [Adiantum capillus-veneris]|uniref:ADF-H domain-containing protein n=1 Tax=Adiantum capillus-veneris TaxID=13818 RepID=A0A9D4U424_ADICA|nr:hypothetical protein GOP47_0023485 [Adiantum capillus-veneris]